MIRILILSLLVCLSYFETSSQALNRPNQVEKQSGVVLINGMKMYYEVSGKGQPVILLHGWLQTSAFWNEMIPLFSRRFKVYAIDLRGHGKSGQLSDDFSIQLVAEDIIQFMDEMNLQSVNAVGVSFGGLALLEAASSYPDRVKNMILVSTTSKFNGKDNPPVDYGTLANDYRENLIRIQNNDENQVKALFNPEIDYQIDLSEDDLNMIESEVLLIAGDDDPIVPLEDQLTLKRQLPNASLWVIPKAGHIPIGRDTRGILFQNMIKIFD